MIHVEKQDGIRTAQVVLTPRLVERLDRVASSETKSRSLVIREACEQLLRQKEQQGAAA
jgi:metal-responsive CopG/Arc/MetJ family transcriptional regulator